jgi:hypothetical protein
MARRKKSRVNVTAHRAGCSICHHPEIRAIERAYVKHYAERRIEAHYKLPKGSVGRHGRAFIDLERKRRANQILVLDQAIEEATEQIPDMSFKPKDLADLMLAKARLDGSLVTNFKDVTEQLAGKTEKELEHFIQKGEWVEDSDATEVEGPEAVQ